MSFHDSFHCFCEVCDVAVLYSGVVSSGRKICWSSDMARKVIKKSAKTTGQKMTKQQEVRL